jgi:Ion transport protein
MVRGKSLFIYYYDHGVGTDEEAKIQEQLHNITRMLEAAVIVRVLRLAVYLDEIKTFRIIIETLKSLISPFLSMVSVMFSIFYIYAFVGMIFFGGKIDFENEAIRNNDGTPDIWALNNFNDFANSYLVLFELTIVNNWMVTAEMYV